MERKELLLYYEPVVRKPDFCLGENKGADQLRGNREEAGQRLCFCYTDSTISLLSKFKISSLESPSVLVQLGCVRPGLKPKLLVFSREGSNPFVILLC